MELVDAGELPEYEPLTECSNCSAMVGKPAFSNRKSAWFCRVDADCNVKGHHAHKACDRCGNHWTEGVR